MIDAERLLGSMVRNAMSGGRRSRRRRRGRSMLAPGMKGAIGLGALGVAIAAFEHFTQKSQGGGFTPAGATTTPPPPTGAVPPPPPPPGAAAPAGPPPPPPGAETAPAPGQDEALLVIRAMIAAANADHHLDDQERARILQAVDDAGLSAEEREFLVGELEAPLDLASLCARAATPELARQVYLASLMAIEVDNQAERNYLSRLAQRLGLSASEVEELGGLIS